MEAAQAEAQSKAFRIASLVALGVATMTLLLPAYALIYIGPVFGEMFKDFQTSLPVLTSLLQSIPSTAYIVFLLCSYLG
jgi:type II secretory pathway component PulF